MNACLSSDVADLPSSLRERCAKAVGSLAAIGDGEDGSSSAAPVP
jgi:hypothetical protein